ncbi:hypothetical protein ACTXG7_00470 [Mycolicibacterium sp. Dal123E01]|uniref:hypothetical protein n=1 Tax=Mycolicibacterium sp. Dal123E01 TaxID=3457578 RepID=UPI00403EB617
MDDDTGADPGLHTLGASRAEGRPEESAQQELLRAIVVSGDLFRNDEGIRRWVHSAMGEPLIEVLVWDIGRPMTDIRHIEVPVSRAALLFLDHARAAAGCEPSSQTSELFCQLRTGRPQYAVRRPNVLTTVNGV